MRQAHGGCTQRERKRDVERILHGPRGADGDLNQEDSAADGDERGFKRCGVGEDSIGPDVDECRAMQKLGSSLC